MKFYNNKALVGASVPPPYTIDRSLRFRSSASAYLNWTPASAGNRKTWTWSAWIKRGKLGAEQFVFGNYTAGLSGAAGIRFEADDTFTFYNYVGSYQVRRSTSQVFRDPSAWYHIIAVLDTTQATADDRAKLYVNGVQITNFSATADPTQNYDGVLNYNTQHELGAVVISSAQSFFDGYLTEINFIDGQALDPTYFGEYNSDTGVWQPIKYTGTYGTNGFYLNFSDNTSTTTLGYDTSGQGNNWTANNISVTSGVTYDSMTDVPTLTSEDAGNYATLNPLDPPTTNFTKTGTNGNLDGNITSTGAGGCGFFSTQSVSSGKWYVEVVVGTYFTSGNFDCGIINAANTRTTGNGNYGAIGYAPTGYSCFTTGAYANNNTTSASGTSYVTNDVIGIAYDADNGKLWFGKNGTWMSSGDPAAGTNAAFSSIPSGEYVFGFGCASGTSGRYTNATLNFGQRPFAYTPPTGFKSLNTYNLPDSTIVDGSEYFNTVTYSGTGSSLSIPVGFIPDFTWIKRRNATNNHQVFDVLRGSNVLVSNEPGDESDYSLYFDFSSSDGFDLPNASVNMNNSSGTYVAWNWKANGSGVSNTDGSITSTVSANPTAGFSIVTYTGNSTAGATVGHGLGVAPNMVIVKTRDSENTWRVGHDDLTSWAYQLRLDDTAKEALNNNIFNSTAPTSTVFTVGSSATTNESAKGMVAYCFTSIEGYSKFGSYTGNGSTTGDGPFVFLNFRVAFLMVKRTDSTSNWIMFDDKRLGYNPDNDYVYADLINLDGVADLIDLTSNGFKIKSASSAVNTSNGTYIYMAFAENPFKNALAR